LAPERLHLLGHSLSVKEHLEAYRMVDIALDTYPYTGCTTTADALWMGVPVLTVAGRSMVSRQAAAVLTGAGHDEWICKNVEELASTAIELVSNIPRLAKLRANLRRQVAKSQLIDGADLARCTEAAFREWWKQWLESNGWLRKSIDKQTYWGKELTKAGHFNTVTSSPRLEIPVWRGEMTSKIREKYQSEGYEIYDIKLPSFWQGTAMQFERTCKGEKIIINIMDTSGHIESLWQRIYPQLLWKKIN
jgi:protein O-GlcNAc transferase